MGVLLRSVPGDDNSFAVAEANANITWVDQTTKTDGDEETEVALKDQTRGDHEADAELSYAKQSADVQWSHDETVAGEQVVNAATLAGDEETREETYASDDSALQTAEYANAASVTGTLAGTINTPWTQYLAGVAGAASSCWSSNVNVYVGYQNTLAADQLGESIAVAEAGQTQADAQADADHTLAYAEANAAHDQAIDDDAAQQVEQAADAQNNRAFELGLAQGQLDYASLLPNAFDGWNAEQSDIVAADQTYLSDELSAQNTLTETTAGDALTDSTKLAQAQLDWTKAGDAATEGYLYSTALATDQQSDQDALATAGYQSASSASYTTAIAAFAAVGNGLCAVPNPWADYAAAIASAQNTLTSTTAGAFSGEQITLSDADFAQAWADALAQQGLADAQATGATNLSIAQQTAQSNLDLAQAVFANAVSFQFSEFSAQLPPEPEGGSELTAWDLSVDGSSAVRDGITLPLAWAYEGGPAGIYSLPGFGIESLSFGSPVAGGYWLPWSPSGSPEGADMYLNVDDDLAKAAYNGSLSSSGNWTAGQDVLLPPVPNTMSGPITQDFSITSLLGLEENFQSGIAFGVLGAAAPVGLEQSFFAPVPNANLSGVYGVWMLGNGPAPEIVAPLADSTPVQSEMGLGFATTPLAQLSDQSQANPDTTPTAAVQVQNTQATIAAQTPDPLAAAMNEVRTQLLTTDYQEIPVDRIDAMVAARLARLVVTDGGIYVYFASVEGDQIVRYVLHQYSPSTDYSGVIPTPWRGPPELYQVVWQQAIKISDVVGSLQELLAVWNSQAEAVRQVDAYESRAASGQAQRILGTINFVVHATPFLGTADYVAQGEYWEATLSAAGDASLLLTAGFSKVATTSATTARNIRIAAMGVEGVAGAARAGQGFFALSQGKGEDAAGYFGEAMLRFLGVSASAIAELKAAQQTRAVRNPGAVDGIAPSAATARTSWNIWDNWDPKIRGRAIEKLWGRNLPYAFPVIDKMDWATGVATSIKSVNLADKTYQTASQLRSLLKGYLSELATFNGAAFDDVEVLASQIKEKVLRVAIPPTVRYRPTQAQLDVLDQITRAGEREGVRVIFEEVGG